MAYDSKTLFVNVNHYLNSAPCPSLGELSERLQIGRHTIEKVIRMATGKTFRELRSSILLDRAKNSLAEHPNRSIKELSFDLGYNSPRSFCRFVKTVSGCTPKELRQQLPKAG